jgi:hypothetical protein
MARLASVDGDATYGAAARLSAQAVTKAQSAKGTGGCGQETYLRKPSRSNTARQPSKEGQIIGQKRSLKPTDLSNIPAAPP